MTNEKYRRNHSLYSVESMMIEISTLRQNRPMSSFFWNPETYETSFLKTSICAAFAQFVAGLWYEFDACLWVEIVICSARIKMA